MKIRPALPSDARAIADLHVRSWQSTYRGIVPDAYLDALSIDERETLLRESIPRGSPEMWVANSDSEITAWIAFGASRDPDAKPRLERSKQFTYHQNIGRPALAASCGMSHALASSSATLHP